MWGADNYRKIAVLREGFWYRFLPFEIFFCFFKVYVGPVRIRNICEVECMTVFHTDALYHLSPVSARV